MHRSNSFLLDRRPPPLSLDASCSRFWDKELVLPWVLIPVFIQLLFVSLVPRARWMIWVESSLMESTRNSSTSWYAATCLPTCPRCIISYPGSDYYARTTNNFVRCAVSDKQTCLVNQRLVFVDSKSFFVRTDKIKDRIYLCQHATSYDDFGAMAWTTQDLTKLQLLQFAYFKTII